jgi:fructose-1-phosphate kinase PfkB-like protein
MGRELTEDRALTAAMQQLRAAGAQWVVVSDGKRAVWVAGEDGVFRLQPPTVADVVNPIGCGDALAAGMAVAIDRGDELLDAVRYGMATAADRLRLLLPGRVDPARVAAIAATIASERR